MSYRRRLAVVGVGVLGLAGVGYAGYRIARQSPTRAGSATSTTVKPAITGLIDPFGVPPAAYVTSHTINAFVALAYWKDLQPVPGGPIVHPNAIDQAIAQARAAGPDVSVKIRFFAGIHAPDWAKDLEGAPFRIVEGQSGLGGPVPRFWTPRFWQVYADVQAKLAAVYDNVPEMREVTISACTTVFAEPFIRQAEVPSDRQQLLSAGYNDAANRACLRASIDAHQVWQHTRSSMAFNPYQELAPDGTWKPDEAVTESLMDYCRQQLGQRCVLENNSVRAPISKLGPNYGRMFSHMRQLGPPITLQTATPERIGCLVQSECPSGVQGVLDWAVSVGATAVELPSNFTRYPPETLRPYEARLSANLRAG